MTLKNKALYAGELVVAASLSVATHQPIIAAGGGVIIAATFIGLHRK
ncbi:MAG: hypothetical protein KGH57_00675 [Candidatus Micrarchaeota archaeon]|nr:hypothetical protein [Candidatus Micrarchaeota archaeon]